MPANDECTINAGEFDDHERWFRIIDSALCGIDEYQFKNCIEGVAEQKLATLRRGLLETRRLLKRGDGRWRQRLREIWSELGVGDSSDASD